MRRWLPLLLAVAAFFVAALIWLGNGRTSASAFDTASSANTSPDGTSLAAAYLRADGRKVKMLTTPLRAAVAEPNAVAFRIVVVSEKDGRLESNDDEADDDDEQPAKKGDKSHKPRLVTPPPLVTPFEEEWIRGGGRLVLATNLPRGGIVFRNDAPRKATKVFPIWPALDELTTPSGRGMLATSLPPHMHTLFGANDYAIIARQVIGRGDLIVVAAPEMFLNSNLGLDHHLAMLEALAEKRPVYFDEVVHGLVADEGPISLLTEWKLGPLLVLLLIGSLLTFWRNARRIGPAEDDYRDTRNEAVDLVASLGALYGRAMTDAEALALYHEALTRSVAAENGLRGDALHRRVGELTGGAVAPSPHESMNAAAFQRHLTIMNNAFRALERANRGGLDAHHR